MPHRLRRYADDDLKKKLEPVEGVAAVKVGGGLEDEVQVDIDQQKLAQLNLPIDTVIQRLQQENINISGGRLEEGSQRYLVRTVNQFATVDEIREMLVTTQSAGGGAAERGRKKWPVSPRRRAMRPRWRGGRRCRARSSGRAAPSPAACRSA